MVKLELEISLEEFEARRELFEAKLTEKLGAQVRIADVAVLEEEAKRKKRETKKRIVVTIYAVKNPSGNNTDLSEKLSRAKEYLTKDEILDVLLDENGNLSPNITNDEELEVFKIRSVKPAVTILPTDPPPPSFFKTTEGIITLVFGCLAVLLAVIAFVLWRKHAKKRVRMLESREPHLRPNRGLADGENAFYKGKIKQGKMVSPVMTDNQIIGPNGKRFDGKAVDPVSGKVYVFNKTTGERMWLQDMRDGRNGPQSYYGNRNTQSRFGDSHHRVQDLPPPRASIETVHEPNNRASRLQLPGTPEGNS